MKHIFSFLTIALLATSMMAQTGLTCEDAIPVDSNYVGRVEGPGEIWYTAGTYDLPLNVHFIPDDYNSEDNNPYVMIDVTCEEGVYEDPKIDSILTMVEELGFSFPAEMMCDASQVGDRMEYDIFIDDLYREQLSQFGVTYNVKAFVKVTFFEAGTISLKPDTMFSSCVDPSKSKYIALNDTLDILANDQKSVFVLPYTDWQNDSIQFVWTGDEPATVWVAADNCDFNPSTTSRYVYDNYVVYKDKPYKVNNQRINNTIKDNSGGGLLYAKVTSASAGKLVAEIIPVPKPQGNATLLEYGQATSIAANDTSLYCFSKAWTSTQFFSASSKGITMYASAQPAFECSADDANVLAVHPFYKNNGLSELSLSDREMYSLTSNAKDNYIYVRFHATEATAITPEEWAASECADKSLTIISGSEIRTTTSNTSTVYRWRYDDWKGHDMNIYWGGSRGTVTIYLVDTCSFSTASLVLQSSIKAKNTLTVDAATIASWADRVDPDGYLYVRFKPQATGNVTLTSVPSADPIYTTITDTLCFGKEYDWDGTIYTESGTYEQKFTALNGADSTVTLNLTILPEVLPTTDEVTVRYDELPYLWNDSAFTESTVYTATLQDAYGCDSVVTLKLTVLEKSDIKTTDALELALPSAFKVYTMDHADWVAQSVVLHWQGASPLHIFVAKEEVHNLTPYNRHVLHYEMIPAGEEWILTKEQMAAWEAEATAAGGKLYVRFLTEKDGRLTTVPVK